MRSPSSVVLLVALAPGCGTRGTERAVPSTVSTGRTVSSSARDVALCTRRQIEIDGRPEGLLAGDFDGDSKPDLVAATFAPGAVHFWRGGGGPLRPPDAV